jgi:hypothetical protein
MPIISYGGGGVAQIQEYDNLAWKIATEKAVIVTGGDWIILFPDVYTDKAVQNWQHALGHGGVSRYTGPIGRYIDLSNFYRQYLDDADASSDHKLLKNVSGTITILGSEAIDVDTSISYFLTLSISGTSIKCYRGDQTTVRISVTDTSLSQGKFGVYITKPFYRGTMFLPSLKETKLLAPLSEVKDALAFFEAPIVGEGTLESPYSIEIPKKIFEDKILGLRNALSFSYSLFIPTDNNGKPKHDTAIVKVLDQVDRDASLLPIDRCIYEFQQMPKVKKLSREEAIRKALQMDDKLHIFDIVKTPKPSKQQIKEYVEWRKSTFNVEMSELDAERYVSEGKGW